MPINYRKMMDKAMLGVVREVLQQVSDNGPADGQSFYISFRTNFPGVVISDYVKTRYPEEITIVLQYQYKNLVVNEDIFSVNIAFGGMAETISVPFTSMTGFIDPLANFSLQLNPGELSMEKEERSGEVDFNFIRDRKKINHNSKKIIKSQKAGEIISLDTFRKKKDSI